MLTREISLTQWRGLRLLALMVLVSAVMLLLAATPALAVSTFSINDTDGGNCTLFGSWDATSKTCTMIRDIASSEITSGKDGIQVINDGISLNGAGHSITGNDALNGVNLTGRKHCTVKNLTVTHFLYGITIDNYADAYPRDSYNAVYGNTVTATGFGIYIHFSGTNTVDRNSSSGNTDGIYIDAAPVYNEITGNTTINNAQVGISIASSISQGIAGNNASDNGVTGISLDNVGGPSSVDRNETRNNTQHGIVLVSSSSNYIRGNVIEGNNVDGLYIYNSTTNIINRNNFIDNASQLTLNTATGNIFDVSGQGGNYWSNHSSPATGCNNADGNSFCDNPYVFTSGQDNQPWIFRNGWSSYYFTWYDDFGGSNWVLMAQPSSAVGDVWFDLFIGGAKRVLPSSSGSGCGEAGCSPGQLTPGHTIAAEYSGLRDAPVNIAARFGPKTVVSQRSLWPKGGSSLEEVLGTDAEKLSSHFYWTWYDQSSAGYTDWILVVNPNSYPVDYTINIAGSPEQTGTLAAGGRVTPTFPGKMGGPVEVLATISGSGTPAKVMASQRVLSDYGNAFNEVPGIPDNDLNSDYLWTWYDMKTAGARNWVLIANPSTSVIYYQIEIGHDGCNLSPPAGTACRSGTVPASGYVTPTFDGYMAGPVEVKTFSNWLLTVPANSIASQRVLWGPSFEEVPGLPKPALGNGYTWTWYDQSVTGVTNWVLIANTDPAATVYYQVKVGGTPIGACTPLAPGAITTPTFPSTIGGPVEVNAYTDLGCTTHATTGILASQRVLWNGYFNEVLGTNLS